MARAARRARAAPRDASSIEASGATENARRPPAGPNWPIEAPSPSRTSTSPSLSTESSSAPALARRAVEARAATSSRLSPATKAPNEPFQGCNGRARSADSSTVHESKPRTTRSPRPRTRNEPPSASGVASMDTASSAARRAPPDTLRAVTRKRSLERKRRLATPSSPNPETSTRSPARSSTVVRRASSVAPACSDAMAGPTARNCTSPARVVVESPPPPPPPPQAANKHDNRRTGFSQHAERRFMTRVPSYEGIAARPWRSTSNTCARRIQPGKSLAPEVRRVRRCFESA